MELCQSDLYAEKRDSGEKTVNPRAEIRQVLPCVSAESGHCTVRALCWAQVHPLRLQGRARWATLGRGVVIRVGVALAAVLHQEGGVVPGHAEDAIRLVQEDVGQHPAMAVHDDHLPVSCAKQHL